MAHELQNFGRRIASDETVYPQMPLSVTHADHTEMVAIRDIRSVFAVYHAFFMGDMADIMLAEARSVIVPSLFAELENSCRQAFGVTDVYPPVTSRETDGMSCSIGATTGEAVAELASARAGHMLSLNR